MKSGSVFTDLHRNRRILGPVLAIANSYTRIVRVSVWSLTERLREKLLNHGSHLLLWFLRPVRTVMSYSE